MRMPNALHVGFYARDARNVAQDLIGCVLCSEVEGIRTAGIIVEAEAYLEDDPASHAFGGLTGRNKSMFGPPGCAYIYRSYGVHWCLNAVTGTEGRGEAVLIRALEPREGIDIMKRRRGVQSERELCSGPGKLCAALGITGDLDGWPLDRWPLWIEMGRSGERRVVASTRIGITRATDQPWRYLDADSPWVSRKA